MNDDDDKWWQNITLGHVLIVAIGLLLLFGGVQCSLHVSSSSSQQHGDEPK